MSDDAAERRAALRDLEVLNERLEAALFGGDGEAVAALMNERGAVVERFLRAAAEGPGLPEETRARLLETEARLQTQARELLETLREELGRSQEKARALRRYRRS